MWWMIFVPVLAAAQSLEDLDAIDNLDEHLPSYSQPVEAKAERNLKAPLRKITLDEIMTSGIQYGSVESGTSIVRIADNTPVIVPKSFYGKFYKLQDEQGFKYFINEEGEVLFKVTSEKISTLDRELSLYEEPLRYTPAPKIITSVYDKKLNLLPEISFYAGVAQGDFMKDLFNDEKAGTGLTTQFGVHFLSQWKLPLKAGVAIHYENTIYDLEGSGRLTYSSLSLGPQFKSKEFVVQETPVRFQTQFRFSPFAKAIGNTKFGVAEVDFNSSDLLTSLEGPIENEWGELVVGVFFQLQWLSIKDQSEAVKLDSSNNLNKSIGFSVAQVFE